MATGTTPDRPAWPERPMRADARHNYERIVATAREVFSERGAEAPLDEIARRAQVGAGTLYRHFSDRGALIEAVYREEVTTLSDRAYAFLEELPAGESLFAWLREQIRWVTESSGLAITLKATIDEGSPTFDFCRQELRAAVTALLTPAKEAGVVRDDVEPSDLLRLSHGVGSAATYADQAGTQRLISIMFDGLRP